MLEGVLENVLNTYLAPYVNGLNKESMKIGIWSGTMELRSLTLKKNFFQLIGIEGLEVVEGELGCVRLVIGSWKTLTSGKIVVELDGLNVQLRALSSFKKSLDEEVKQARKNKQAAIEIRENQLVKEQEQKLQEEGVGGDLSFAAKLARRLINNIFIQVTNLNFCFVDTVHQVTVGVDLPSLAVKSTDGNWNVSQNGKAGGGDSDDKDTDNLFKLLELNGLSIWFADALNKKSSHNENDRKKKNIGQVHIDGVKRPHITSSAGEEFQDAVSDNEEEQSLAIRKKQGGATGGATDDWDNDGNRPEKGKHILKPCRLALKLAHLPKDGTVKLQFEFTGEKKGSGESLNGVALSRRQFISLQRIGKQLSDDQMRVKEILMPAHAVELVGEDPVIHREEYIDLYAQKLFREYGLPVRRLRISPEKKDSNSSSDHIDINPVIPDQGGADHWDETKIAEPGYLSQRLSVFDDVISVFYLGKWRAIARSTVEKMRKIHEKARNEELDKIKKAKEKQQGWGGWLLGRKVQISEEETAAVNENLILDTKSQMQLMNNLETEVATMEEIDIPKKMVFGILCSSFTVALLEDEDFDGSNVYIRSTGNNAGSSNNKSTGNAGSGNIRSTGNAGSGNIRSTGAGASTYRSGGNGRTTSFKPKMEQAHGTAPSHLPKSRTANGLPRDILMVDLRGLSLLFASSGKVDARGFDSQEWLTILGAEGFTATQYELPIIDKLRKKERGIAGEGANNKDTTGSGVDRDTSSGEGASSLNKVVGIKATGSLMEDIERCALKALQTEDSSLQSLRESLVDCAIADGKFLLFNKLESNRNVLGISYEALPLSMSMRNGVLGNIMGFFDTAKQVEAEITALAQAAPLEGTQPIIDLMSSPYGGPSTTSSEPLGGGLNSASVSGIGIIDGGLGQSSGQSVSIGRMKSLGGGAYLKNENIERGVETIENAVDAAIATYEENKEKITKFLPDAMDLYLTLLSPVVEFVTLDGASATFSLGNLQCFTPLPCVFQEAFTMKVYMNETSLKVSTVQSERFYVLRPVPINVDLSVKSKDGCQFISVMTEIETMRLNVAPQACRVLLKIPDMISSILERNADADGGDDGFNPNKSLALMNTSTDMMESLPLQNFKAFGTQNSTRDFQSVRDQSYANNSGVLRQNTIGPGRLTGIGEEEDFNGLPRTQSRRSTIGGANLQAAQDAYTRLRKKFQEKGIISEEKPEEKKKEEEAKGKKAVEPKKSTMSFNMTASFARLELILGDTVIPVLQTNMRLPDLFINYQMLSNGETVMNLSTNQGFFLDIQLYNTRSGVWEPLLEPFVLNYFTVNIVDSKEIKVDLAASEKPLLINLSPTAVSRLLWFLPYFLREIFRIEGEDPERALDFFDMVLLEAQNLANKDEDEKGKAKANEMLSNVVVKALSGAPALYPDKTVRIQINEEINEVIIVEEIVYSAADDHEGYHQSQNVVGGDNNNRSRIRVNKDNKQTSSLMMSPTDDTTEGTFSPGTGQVVSKGNHSSKESQNTQSSHPQSSLYSSDEGGPLHSYAQLNFTTAKFHCVNLLPFSIAVQFWATENIQDNNGWIIDDNQSSLASDNANRNESKAITNANDSGACPENQNSNASGNRGNGKDDDLLRRGGSRVVETLLINPSTSSAAWNALDLGILPTLADNIDCRLVKLQNEQLGHTLLPEWHNLVDVMPVSHVVENSRNDLMDTADLDGIIPVHVSDNERGHSNADFRASAAETSAQGHDIGDRNNGSHTRHSEGSGAVKRRPKLCVYQHGGVAFGASHVLQNIRFVARMLNPDPSYKLLVLTTETTLHNTLSVPVKIRMNQQVENLAGLCGKRSFLRTEPEVYAVKSFYENHTRMELEKQEKGDRKYLSGEAGLNKRFLNPQEFMSVIANMIEIKPFDFSWSEPIDLAPQNFSAYYRNEDEGKIWCLGVFSLRKASPDERLNKVAPKLHFLLTVERVSSGPPMNRLLREIHIIPPLILENALPCHLRFIITTEAKGLRPVQVIAKVEPLSVWHCLEIDPRAVVNLQIQVWNPDDPDQSKEYKRLPEFSPYEEERRRRKLLHGGGKAQTEEDIKDNYFEIWLKYKDYREFQCSAKVGLKTKIFCPVWIMDKTCAHEGEISIATSQKFKAARTLSGLSKKSTSFVSSGGNPNVMNTMSTGVPLSKDDIPLIHALPYSASTIDKFPCFYGSTLVGNLQQSHDVEDRLVEIGGQLIELPSDYCAIEGTNLCLQGDVLNIIHTHMQVFYVVYRTVFHNKESHGTVFEVQRMESEGNLANPQSSSRGVDAKLDRLWDLSPGETVVPHRAITHIRFRIKGGHPAWSAPVVLADNAAGEVPYTLGDGTIVTVQICPGRGCLGVNFRLGSDYVIQNHSSNYVLCVNGMRAEAIEQTTRDLRRNIPGFIVSAMDVGKGFTETHFGWRDPFVLADRVMEPSNSNVGIPVLRQEQDEGFLGSGISANSGGLGAHMTSEQRARQRWLLDIEVRCRKTDLVLEALEFHVYESKHFDHLGAKALAEQEKQLERLREQHFGEAHVANVVGGAIFPKSATNLSLYCTRRGNLSILQLTEDEPVSEDAKIEIAADLKQLGVSLISEVRGEEFLYLQFDLFKAKLQSDRETMTMNLVVFDAQIDCQLQTRQEIWDVSDGKGDAPDTLLPDQIAITNAPVVLGNRGAGGDTGHRPFLEFVVQRTAKASRDLVIPICEISIDELELNIDDEILENLLKFGEGMSGGQNKSECLSLNDIKDRAVDGSGITGCGSNRAIYKPPDVPPVLQIDSLRISKIELLLWVSLLLDNMDFLSEYVKAIIRILSLGGALVVEKGHIVLEPIGPPIGTPIEDERNRAQHHQGEMCQLTPFRGGVNSFLENMMGEYRNYALRQIMGLLVMLGRTIHLARTPAQVLQKTGGFVVDGISSFFGSGVNVVTHLTFDDDYIKQQKAIRRNKQKEIDGILSGGGEAIKSLGDGVVGIFDVVTKPVEGLVTEGIGGFFTGIGKGVMGTIVKPVTKVGEALADVGSGVSAAIAPDGGFKAGKHRKLTMRKRPPRLLYGDLCAMGNYSILEARVLEHCQILCRQCQVVLPLWTEESATLTEEDYEDKTQEEIAELQKRGLYVLLCHQNLITLVRIPMMSTKQLRFGDGDGKDDDDDEGFFGAIGNMGADIGRRVLVPVRTVGGVVERVAENVFTLDGTDIYDIKNAPNQVKRRVIWQCVLDSVAKVSVTKEKRNDGNRNDIIDGNDTSFWQILTKDSRTFLISRLQYLRRDENLIKVLLKERALNAKSEVPIDPQLLAIDRYLEARQNAIMVDDKQSVSSRISINTRYTEMVAMVLHGRRPDTNKYVPGLATIMDLEMTGGKDTPPGAISKTTPRQQNSVPSLGKLNSVSGPSLETDGLDDVDVINLGDSPRDHERAKHLRNLQKKILAIENTDEKILSMNRKKYLQELLTSDMVSGLDVESEDLGSLRKHFPESVLFSPIDELESEIEDVLRGASSDWKMVKISYDNMIRARTYYEMLHRSATTSLGTRGGGQFGEFGETVNELKKVKRVECFEVERNIVFSWGTAGLPTDGDPRWRWLTCDRMSKHPNIDPKLSRSEVTKAKKPPFVFSSLWTPKGAWEIVIDKNTTDNKGWTYSVNWHNKSWSKEEGLIDYVRRRKWIRDFE